jgi:hypothetical protein
MFYCTKLDMFFFVFIIPSLMGGGAERVLISLANHVAEQKIETVLIALNEGISVYAINENE